MATAEEYYQKANEVLTTIPDGATPEATNSILMKAASFFQMAIKAAAPTPYAEAESELAFTLFRAGDERCFNQAVKALNIDPSVFEARIVVCVITMSEYLGHQGYRPEGLINTNDLAATGANLLIGGIIGGFSLANKANKGKKANDAVYNLAESFKQNVQDKKYKSGFYLWAAGMLIFVVEVFEQHRITKPLLDSIMAANWSGLELTEEEQNQLEEIKMQAEGTIMFFK